MVSVLIPRQLVLKHNTTHDQRVLERLCVRVRRSWTFLSDTAMTPTFLAVTHVSDDVVAPTEDMQRQPVRLFCFLIIV